MLVPLSWLREYVDVSLSPEALAEQLTLRGHGGAGHQRQRCGLDRCRGRAAAQRGAASERGQAVADERGCRRRRPAADRVRRRQHLGRRPGAGRDGRAPCCPATGASSARRSAASSRRGCSARAIELGLGDDAEGIHLLGGAGDELPLGAPLGPIVGEVVLDVDVKPNRGDALSMVGLAREVAAITGAVLRLPDASVQEDPSLQTADHVSVEIADPAACPRFAARWLEDVHNGASPPWMQQRLLAAGMRPISAVVDVTNYVMHELGQPMHAYDADTIPDGRIVVRRARSGETLETIDHEQRALDERMLVIADRERPIGLAGIMGGAGTEVTREHATRDPGVGDLPRPDHPQHRPPPGAALGGEHAPREGDRPRAAALRGRPRRAADGGDHRRARGVGHRRQRPGAGERRGWWRWSLPRVERLLGISARRARRCASCCGRSASRSSGDGAAGGDGAGSSAGRRRLGGRRGGDRPRPRLRSHPGPPAGGRAAAVPAGSDRSRGIGSGASWPASAWTRWCCTR